MDPLTHGLLGAAAAQAVFIKRLPRSAWLIGFAAALLPDVDTFLPHGGDALYAVAAHRGFTHSLLFIPIGALIAAAVFMPWRVFEGRRLVVYGAALVAYATHGLLDACTAYGTVLFWPFSDRRVAWDLIGIIDFAFTLALFAGVLLAAKRSEAKPARVALAFCIAYMSLGAIQHHRVLTVQQEIAQARGNTVEHARAIPLPGTLVLWRSLYLSDGYIYSDGVRAPLPGMGTLTVEVGRRARHVTANQLKDEGVGEAALDVFRRFAWFTDGFTAWDERSEGVIGDMRYAVRPDLFSSMWGLKVSDVGWLDQPQFARRGGARDEAVARMWDALTGADDAYMTVGELGIAE